MWSEIKRKLFHLTALIYVAGIIYLPRRAYVAVLAVALLVVGGVEAARLSRPSVNAWFQRWFGGLFREEERNRPTGVLWMLGGVLLTAVVVAPTALAATALLYLILGDGIASVAGKGLGGPRWPGSPKRLAGSLACLLVCLAVGALVLRPGWGWHGIVLGAAAATFLEWGPLPGNDNLTIPLGAGAALLLAYGIPPFIH
jgi:dolichol kinase